MQPAKPFTLKKRGLTPNEFEECITSKVNELFKGFSTGGIITLMQNCVQKVRQKVCTGKTAGTNDSLDRRHSSSDSLFDFPTTPIRAPTPTRPGRQRNNRASIKRYHDKQHHLFSNFLIPNFRDVFRNITLKENDKGFFFWRDSYSKLTPEECCNVIDQITIKYIKYFFQLKESTVNLSNQKRNGLQAEYDCCLLILEDRLAVDWNTENDLMDRKGYNEWKRHVIIEMSYAALSVVLAMILSRHDEASNSQVWLILMLVSWIWFLLMQRGRDS